MEGYIYKGLIMENSIPKFTPDSAPLMQKMIKNLGTTNTMNAITDYGSKIDFNKDGKISGNELSVLFQSITEKGKVNEDKLKKNIKNYKNNNIITVSQNIGKNKRRDIVYFKNYTDINEYQNNKLTKIIGVDETSITITEFQANGKEKTVCYERTKETEEKYLKNIELTA